MNEHVMYIWEEKDGKIGYNENIVLNYKYQYNFKAYTEKKKLHFISYVLTSLTKKYFEKFPEEKVGNIRNLYFNNYAFASLKNVLKKERNATLEYKCENSFMSSIYRKDSWEFLFGKFEWYPEQDLKKRYIQYCEDMEDKIKEYIFGDYTLEEKYEKYYSEDWRCGG